MQHDAIRYLLEQYANGKLTPSGEEELLQLLGADNETDLIPVLREMIEAESVNANAIDPDTLQASLQQVLMVDKPAPPVMPRMRGTRVLSVNRRWAWMAAAVCIIIAGAIAVYVMNKKKAVPEVAKTAPAQNDVQPGGNKAILTLANGQQIVLDSAANGNLAQQGGAQVVKEEGSLRYEAGSTKPETAWNMLSTPRGGQYKLVLPDGSKVWLNAASSIRYPAVFTGNERSVEITGEVYFEVTKNQHKPFRVHFPNGEVEVLGTHFNINAYDDEASSKTTLLEGKVKVSSVVNSEWSIIKPGEQAITSSNSPLTIDHSPDLDQVTAWTNGLFIFRNQDIETIMRQISRWYDVQITYDRRVKNEKMVATISRSVPVSKVLHLLELTGLVHFKIEGKKILVLP
jgi:ferric-dicitrate binding protein FerR (iron transport regulator)